MIFSTAARAFLAELSIAPPPNFDVALDNLIRTMNVVDDQNGNLTGRAIAAGWRRFLDLDKVVSAQDTIEKVCLLAAFHSLTSPPAPSIELAFSEERFNYYRSRIEMSLRLASRLFMLGRKGKFGSDTMIDSLRLLQVSIRYSDEAANNESRLQPPALRRLFGMRGVAQLLIARTGTSSLGGLRQAANDLDRSNQFGDDTPQNLVYRRECALRLYEIERKLDDLDRLGRLLEQPSAKDRQYYTDLTWYYSYRAQLAIGSNQSPDGFLALGVNACDAGLATPADLNAADAVFYNLRGFLYFLSAQVQFLKDRTISDQHIEFAIVDLRRAARAGMGGASLALALLRRSLFTRMSNLAAAESDLNEALGSAHLIADSTVAERIGRQIKCSLMDCRARRAIDSGEASELLESSGALLSYGEESTRYAFTLSKVVRVLLKEEDGGSLSEEVRERAEAVLVLAERRMLALPADDDGGATLRRYLARISLRLDGGSVSRRTLRFFRSAVEDSRDNPAELYSQAADTALRFGKIISREGEPDEAARLFKDAVQWYERAFEVFERDPNAVSDSFILVVCHSKIGEAYLRMRSGSLGPNEVATRAIGHLTEAPRLGNETPELLGLLGDAYYRRGYPTSNKADLLKAIELKSDAQRGGHLSREGWSVMARLYGRLFDIEGDTSVLAKAFHAALESHAHSPSWPWPLFQLAELAALPAKAREIALAQLPAELGEREVARALRRGDRIYLLGAGAKLAVDGTEFRQQVLGGRSGVFVLEDPHRLLSTTMVLKPTIQKNAETEIATTREFGKHIDSSGLGRKYSVPIPIAIIPRQGDDVTYVMERARATSLADIFLGSSGLGYGGQTSEIADTLELLELYHQWNGVRNLGQRWRLRLTADFRNLLSRYGMQESAVRQSEDLFERILPKDLPGVRKKDAHPENWMVTSAGKIVMIDLEATSWQPMLLDVVQLVDDYPVFHSDQEGWRARMALAHQYWKNVLGAEAPGGLIESTYTAFTIYRCAFGILRCSQSVSQGDSSSSLKALELRIGHFQALLTFLATSSISPPVRALSGTLRESASQLVARKRVEDHPKLGEWREIEYAIQI